MRRSSHILQPEFTDLALIVGPTIRWVEDDYSDLQRYAPEVLLGYRVLLVTPDTVRKVQGLRVSKIVVLDGLYQHSRWGTVLNYLRWSQAGAYFPKFERYSVDRGQKPVVQRLPD